MMKYVLLVAGFFLLIKGADLFVEASSSVAKRLRVPSIIIGLTIVAFGTSAPELAVSTTASLAGNNEIAVGNVIGSNIFNLMVVLGACAAIHPFAVRLRWDYAISVGVAAALFVMICFDHYISRVDALMLLAFFLLFVGLTVRDALVNRVVGGEEYQMLSPVRSLVYIVCGLAAIIWGGDLVVDSASSGHRHLPAGAGDLCGSFPEGGERSGPGQCDRLQYFQHPDGAGCFRRSETHCRQCLVRD